MMICSLTAPGSGRTTGAGKIVASQRRLFQSAFHLRLQSLPCPVAVTSTRGWTELSRERSRLIEVGRTDWCRPLPPEPCRRISRTRLSSQWLCLVTSKRIDRPVHGPLLSYTAGALKVVYSGQPGSGIDCPCWGYGELQGGDYNDLRRSLRAVRGLVSSVRDVPGVDGVHVCTRKDRRGLPAGCGEAVPAGVALLHLGRLDQSGRDAQLQVGACRLCQGSGSNLRVGSRVV